MSSFLPASTSAQFSPKNVFQSVLSCVIIVISATQRLYLDIYIQQIIWQTNSWQICIWKIHGKFVFGFQAIFFCGKSKLFTFNKLFGKQIHGKFVFGKFMANLDLDFKQFSSVANLIQVGKLVFLVQIIRTQILHQISDFNLNNQDIMSNQHKIKNWVLFYPYYYFIQL
eukprot:TRINITY_DN6994_c0_g1_i2.p4 TRINITY_DN6994_c0_g1~~TRINITY_DN6994_c0_g1_i2.p4  ORF type:complete len:169 (-),score=1.38 TRINITY_DN6994_c0_g1_i2:1224-1730(-)